VTDLRPGQIEGDVTLVTGTTHTVEAVSAGGLIRFNNALGVEVTLQADADDDIQVGATILINNVGTGAVTFAAGTGATLATTGNSIAAGAAGLLIKTAANTWAVCVGGASE
jgi:hypothetical protein